MAALITTGRTLHTGDETLLDRNLPVTIVEIIPPYEEGDLGSVIARYSWGETATVTPDRLGAYITTT